MPEPIVYGLLAFQHALEQDFIEFRIPAMVRAAETILALPKKNGGAAEFAKRSQLLIAHLDQDRFLGGRLGGLLVQLYYLRSECVHGKVPFEIMKQEGGHRPLKQPDWTTLPSNWPARLLFTRCVRPLTTWSYSDSRCARRGLEDWNAP